MLDHFDVCYLIAEGEGHNVDFKQSVSLADRNSQGELIKDIVSLANSASDTGYLLVGIDDDGIVVGAEPLPEEQIQQIVSTYVTPAIKLRHYTVAMETPGLPLVSVLEVESAGRPHKVARAIGKLDQDSVFVRHGTTVARASPEEIQSLYDQAGENRQVRQYVKAAKAHLALGNVETAISAYTRAIELTATPELFAARAEAYRQRIDELEQSCWNRHGTEVMGGNDQLRKLRDLAAKDLTDALTLSQDEGDRIRYRIQRLAHLYASSGYDYEEFNAEADWLKAHTEGVARAAVIVAVTESWDIFDYEGGQALVEAMDEVLDLGLVDAEVYVRRADGHAFATNYCSAVADIDKALEILDKNRLDQYIRALCIRAHGLIGMGRYDEARKTLMLAKSVSAEATKNWFFSGSTCAPKKLLESWALRMEFDEQTPGQLESVLLKTIILWYARELASLKELQDGSLLLTPRLVEMSRDFPGIWSLAHRILGNALLEDAMSDQEELVVRTTLPRLHDQIPKSLSRP